LVQAGTEKKTSSESFSFGGFRRKSKERSLTHQGLPRPGRGSAKTAGIGKIVKESKQDVRHRI